ncbi:MAG: hypothetical protein DRQ55_05445 [Planctomycetota bacterium]|nr:MAG: hypothetical protein DRQ55_05445 [Planctomycetota bacterium]
MALIALLLGLGVLVFVWPRDERSPPRELAMSELFTLEHPGERGFKGALVVIQQRLQARERLDVVLSLPAVAALQLDQPEGEFELQLGDRAQRWCSLVLVEQKLRMSVGQGQRTTERALLERPRGSRLGLTWADGRAWALVAGERQGSGLPCAEPSGPSRVGFWRRASVRAVRITTTDGQLHTLSADEIGP